MYPMGLSGVYISIMETSSSFVPALSRQAPRVIPSIDQSIEIPSWEIAQRLVFPHLEPVPCAVIGSAPSINFTASLARSAAQTGSDPLSSLLTGCLKMTLALFYGGAIIPLSENLLREWSVSLASVLFAMDANLGLVSRSSWLVPHEKGPIHYYSLHSDAAPFNSAVPFFPPFQAQMARVLGSPFYFAVPERRTVILFGAEYLPFYRKDLRDDVLLTWDDSTSALSPELIEVSESGALPVFR